nr:archaeosortase/exosortase family protein [Marinobacter salsuginis]
MRSPISACQSAFSRSRGPYWARGALKLIPYLLLLSLSLPIWADLIPILVDMATIVVGSAVSAMGITALIEGSNITLAYGRLVIADGCSGIGFLAIAMLLGAFTAILNDYRWRGWAMIMSISIVLALVINWVRIIALVLIADWTNMESSLVREHELFGWIVFAAFILPALVLAPVRRRKTLQTGNDHVISYSGFGFIFTALVAGTGVVFLVQAREIEEPPLSLTSSDFSEISAPALPIPLQVPDQLEQKFYVEEGTGVYVSLAQIQRHSPEQKIVPYLPPLVDRDIWFREATPAPGKEIWRRISTPERVVVSHIYAIGAYRTDTYVKAKLLQLPAIYSGRTRFALISLQTVCETSTCDEGLDRLAAFEAATDI